MIDYDFSTLRLKRHWFGENNNFINTAVDYPLNEAPDQIQNVICLNRASLFIQNGLWPRHRAYDDQGVYHELKY